MKIMNRKGSILQIVLIILMVLLINVLTFFHLTIIQAKSIQAAHMINDERILEMLLIHYYKYETKYGLLLSDHIENQQYTIDYTVDDMGDNYYIDTKVKLYKYDYSFSLEINKENYHISSFKYE